MIPKVSTPPRDLSIIVVDDHPAICDAITLVVADCPGLTVAGTAGTAEEAFALVRSSEPDVAVVDLSLSDAHGLDLVRALRSERPEMGIVVFSMYEEAVYAERALRAGAQAYVRKTEPTATVIEAVRAAAAGDIFLARAAASRLLAQATSPGGLNGKNRSGGLSELTDREMAVFDLLGQGRDPDAIADQLSLSRKTVETYRRRAKEKLGLGSVTELLQFAIRWRYAQGAED